MVARIGSANSTPKIPNIAPISNCMARTTAGARSTVRLAMYGTTRYPSMFWTKK